MKSIKDIYKIGKGPSSSHTMGPAKAMGIFVSENSDADSFEVTLFGSLADTGEGHGTSKAIEMMTEKPVAITLNTKDRDLPHENTMDILAIKDGAVINKMRVMSVGGGDIRIEGRGDPTFSDVYPEKTFSAISSYCKKEGIPVIERPFTMKELYEADEVIVSSSGAFAQRARWMDGVEIGGKDPTLLARLQRAMQKDFEEQTAE